MKTFLRGSVAATVLLASSAFAAEPVVIVTSFPDTMTTVIEKAFEEAHPEYDLEVLNKSTSSGVKYIQEIAGSNTADLFWASAPDAFARSEPARSTRFIFDATHSTSRHASASGAAASAGRGWRRSCRT